MGVSHNRQPATEGQRLSAPGEAVKMWRVKVDGFPSYTLEAETRSKARARAWGQYCDGWCEIPFCDFFPLVRIRKMAGCGGDH